MTFRSWTTSSQFRAGKNLWVGPSFFDNGRRMKVSAVKLGIVEVIHKLCKSTTYMLDPEDVLQKRYRLVMKRARDQKQPRSLRLLKEFLEVVCKFDLIGPLRLPKQHDWQSPTNLPQRALDRIFRRVRRRITRQFTQTYFLSEESDFFILQDGTMGLIPFGWKGS
jgi:hypothetical protein